MWNGQADRRYCFPWGMVVVDHYWEEFALTHVGGDIIAAATPCRKYSPSIHDGVLINIYDLQQTLTNYCCIPPVSSMEYDNLGVIGQYHIKDLRYSTVNRLFSILMTGTFNSIGNNTVIAQIQYPGGTTLEMFARKDVTSFSMDHFMNQSRPLAMGRDDINSTNSLYLTLPNLLQGNCFNYNSDPLPSGQFDSKSDLVPYSTCNGKFDCVIKQVSVNEINANIECQ